MLQLNPISLSETNVFYEFDKIYKMAKSMKNCHFFYLCRLNRKLYGCHETRCTLHEISIPDNIYIPCPLAFTLSCIDSDMVEKYKGFVLYLSKCKIMLPFDDKFDNHTEYNFYYDDDNQLHVEYNENPVEYLTILSTQQELNICYDMLVQKWRNDPFLSTSIHFCNQEINPVVMEVINSKVTAGSKPLILTDMSGKKYGMFIFRNLFSLNKADQLDIIITGRKDNYNLFQTTFIIKKKKSPIPTIIPQYEERVYGTFLNLV